MQLMKEGNCFFNNQIVKEEIRFFLLYPPLCSNISMRQKIAFLLSFNTEMANGIGKIHLTDLRRRVNPLNGETVI